MKPKFPMNTSSEWLRTFISGLVSGEQFLKYLDDPAHRDATLELERQLEREIARRLGRRHRLSSS